MKPLLWNTYRYVSHRMRQSWRRSLECQKLKCNWRCQTRCFNLWNNNTNRNVLEDIVKGIKHIIQLINYCKFYNSRIKVSVVRPWEFSPVIWRDKIESVNIQIKYVVAKINNNIPYIDPGHTWAAGSVF